MNRYLFYMIVLVFIALMSVQQVIFLDEAYRGSLMSILLAFIAGTGFIVWLTRLFSRFPNQGLPEIAHRWLPRPLAVPFLLVQSALWFATGVFPLLYMCEVAKRFIDPDYATNEPLALFLAVIVMFVNIHSLSLLYFIEIILVLTLPLLVVLCFKSYFSDQLMSYSMMEAASRILEAPTYGAFSAAVLLFCGCMGLVVFNRHIAPKVVNLWYLLLLSAGCFAFLLTAYFIPIGLFGADGIQYINYPWYAVADTLRMQYGFVDRILFITIPLNIFTTLALVLMTWHVGLQLWKSVWPNPRTVWGNLAIAYVPIAALFVFLEMVENELGFTRVKEYAAYWNWGQPVGAILVLLLLSFAARRSKRSLGGGTGT